jgi:hypothetical protein
MDQIRAAKRKRAAVYAKAFGDSNYLAERNEDAMSSSDWWDKRDAEIKARLADGTEHQTDVGGQE